MRIQYSVEMEDLKRCLIYVQCLNQAPGNMTLVVRACLTVIGLQEVYGRYKSGLESGEFQTAVIAALILAAALIWLAPWLGKTISRLEASASAKYNYAFPVYYELELLDGGLIEYSDHQSLELKWTRLARLINHRGRIYIVAKGQEFIVVPASAFRDNGQRSAFIERLSAISGLPVEGRAFVPAEL